MKKLPPAEKSSKTQMEYSDLTEPEMDAALQLIQLSCDSAAESFGDAAKTVEQSREESVGDSNSHEISSAIKIRDLGGSLPRRKKRRYRPLVDVYSVTKPVIKKQRAKKPKI